MVIISPICHEIYYSKDGNKSEFDFYVTTASLYSQEDTDNFAFQLYTDFPGRNNSNSCYLFLDYDVIYHNGEINEFQKNTKLLDKKNNYSVNGIIYSNVKIFESKYNDERRIFYWAKYEGVIRIETYKNKNITVKNLIKYNVKPYNQ